MFYFDKITNKKILRSDLISEVDVFFTTREFCLFSKTEDKSDNRQILFNYLQDIPAENQPVHGVHIEKIINDKKYYTETDGLLIENSGSAFMHFGDCTPLVFYCDKIAMISHAGWRGTVQSMAKVSLKKLVEEYNCRQEDIKVIIGPAICKSCYCVGKDVYEQLQQTVLNKEDMFEERDGQFFVDLKAINRQQLIESGVENIDVCPYCTACGEKLFYSYRYEKTGNRHSAVICLR